ncbi:TMEM175 family protein [Streptomyces sp. NPDC048483]|uniref:TMEM175 family protein n=1 Tax=Streptomyces sp. NPDC048483 TaxID=3154927 RepID=UPI00344876DC
MAVPHTDGAADGPAKAAGPDRLIALSDGIFAIAMTLLVLDVSVPDGLGPRAFETSVHQLWPKVGAYALSFTILAAFWRDHRQIFQWVRQVDALLERLTLLGLGAIALLPFPTALLSEYSSHAVSVAVYALAIAVIDLLHLALFHVVWRRRHLQARPVDDRYGRDLTADLGTTVLVFGVSVPLAFVSPAVAMWTWLALVPLKFWLGRRAQARSDEADNERSTP